MKFKSDIEVQAGLKDSSGSAGTSGKILSSTGTGVAWVDDNPGISGTGTTNYVSKFTGTTSLGDSQIFDNGTNIGIGTSSPSEKLSIASSTSPSLGLSLTPAGWNNARHRFVVPLSGDSSQLSFNWNGSAKDYSGYGSSLVGLSQGTIIFSNGDGDPTERMRIANGGNVGIGTSNPLTKLHVAGGYLRLESSGDKQLDFVGSGKNTYSIEHDTARIYFYNGSTGGVPLAILNGGNIGMGTANPSSPLHIVRSGGAKINLGDSQNTVAISSIEEVGDSAMGFYTQTSIERMRITSGGNVGIGTTAPQDKLTVKGSTDYNLNLGLLGGYSGIYVYNDASSAYNTLRIDASPLLLNTYSGSNVGIGLSAPSTKLHVDGADYSFIAGYDSGNRRVYIGLDSTGEPSIQGALSNGTARQISINPNGGNVGIGTTSPTEKLTIAGGNISLGAGYKLQYSSTAYMTPENNTSGAEITTPGVLTIKTGGTTERVRVDASGNVGIGTSNPEVSLDVVGINGGTAQSRVRSTSGGDIRMSVDTVGRLGTYSNSDLALLTNGTTKAIITAAGNVGIGTTSPGSPLDVQCNSSALGINIRQRSGNDFANLVFSNTSNTGLGSVGYVGTSRLRFTTNGLGDANEKLSILANGNVGIGTTSPGAKLDVNGDALINGLTVGRGGGNSAFNTALGVGALGGNTSGEYNIAIGRSANYYSNLSGTTVIGADLFTNPSGISGLTSNSIAISQYNPNNAGTQYPHIYAPDKVNCPNGDTTTDVIAVDYSIYTAIFMEYSIFNSAGDQFRAGTYTASFKGSGTPVDNDNQTVVYSLTTLLATFTISITGSIATIQLRNQDTDTYDIRVTARLLMR